MMTPFIVSAKRGGSNVVFGELRLTLQGNSLAIKEMMQLPSQRKEGEHIRLAAEDAMLSTRLVQLSIPENRNQVPHLESTGEGMRFVFQRCTPGKVGRYELVLTICHYNAGDEKDECYGIYGGALLYVFPAPPEVGFDQQGFFRPPQHLIEAGLKTTPVQMKEMEVIARSDVYVVVREFGRGDFFEHLFELSKFLRDEIQSFWKKTLLSQKEPLPENL